MQQPVDSCSKPNGSRKPSIEARILGTIDPDRFVDRARHFQDSSTPSQLSPCLFQATRDAPCDLDRAISADTSSSTNQWISQQTRRDGIRSATLDVFVSMNIRSPVRRRDTHGERERARARARHSGARTCNAPGGGGETNGGSRKGRAM